MSWRSKFLFLLIVYFAGFATAIYYLAPSGKQDYQTDSYSYRSDVKSEDNGGIFYRFCDKAVCKASASFSGMKMEDFKERFNQGLQKLMEMAKTSRVSAEVEGGEDK